MLGESAGRGRKARVRPEAIRRMDDDERLEHTPRRYGEEVVPFDDVPIGGWGMMRYIVWAIFFLANAGLMAVFLLMPVKFTADVDGWWYLYAWAALTVYTTMATALAFERGRPKAL